MPTSKFVSKSQANTSCMPVGGARAGTTIRSSSNCSTTSSNSSIGTCLTAKSAIADFAEADAAFATQAWETFGEGMKRSFKVSGAEESTIEEQPALISISYPGVYTLRVSRYEVGAVVDALVVQQSHLAPPIGDGPAAAACDEEGVFELSGGVLALEAEDCPAAPADWRGARRFENARHQTRQRGQLR